MGFKTLELTLISAKDLKNVNLIGKMDVYVVVSISGDPRTRQKTPVHQDSGTKPAWNYTMRFTIDDTAAVQFGQALVFQVKHEHTLGPDKDLGEVRVPLKDLIGAFADKKDARVVNYPVRRPNGKAKGELKFSYKLMDSPVTTSYPTQARSAGVGYDQPPVTAYPPHASSSAAPPYAYPPPPVAYPPAGYPGAAYPQAAYGGYHQPGYGGYPPPGYGYGGYPPGGYPVQAQRPKRGGGGGFGMGMGAGLLGGALGGLLIGDMVSDAYEDGYEDGADGDFDF